MTVAERHGEGLNFKEKQAMNDNWKVICEQQLHMEDYRAKWVLRTERVWQKCSTTLDYLEKSGCHHRLFGWIIFWIYSCE